MAHGQWSGGKGSAQRPVDKKKYSDNWDAIFGKKETTKDRAEEGTSRKKSQSRVEKKTAV
jgi:hypothetical protein